MYYNLLNKTFRSKSRKKTGEATLDLSQLDLSNSELSESKVNGENSLGGQHSPGMDTNRLNLFLTFDYFS